MSTEDQVRLAGLSRALADHVARRIDTHAGEPRRPELLGIGLGARRFLERGRGDFTQTNLILDGPRFVRPNGVERGANRRQGGQTGDIDARPRHDRARGLLAAGSGTSRDADQQQHPERHPDVHHPSLGS